MDKDCTIYNTAEVIGKRWTLLIIFEIYKRGDDIRFGELKTCLPGITSKMLSARLKELERYKLIQKKVSADEFPVSCEYSLTRAGAEFIRIIKEMKKWAIAWHIGKRACEKTDCKDCRF